MADTSLPRASLSLVLNGEAYEFVAAGSGPTVADLLRRLELGARRVAVELNGEVVPRAEHASRRLAAGDRVEVVTFVGGG